MTNLFETKKNDLEKIKDPFRFIANIQVGMMLRSMAISENHLSELVDLHAKKLKLQFPSIDELRYCLGYFEYFDVDMSEDDKYLVKFAEFSRDYHLDQDEKDQRLMRIGSVILTEDEENDLRQISQEINRLS